MDTDRRTLPLILVALALGLGLIALLGPLLTGVIDYRYSQTMLNQATGLDAFALAVVAPIAILAAVLIARRSPAGPLLALAPAGFALYMLVQYVIGPEYLLIDGNGERAFLLFVALFAVAGTALFSSWARAAVPALSDRTWRRRGGTLLVLAVFVVVGMYLTNGFGSAMSDFPAYVEGRAAVSEYEEHPTAYWIVAFLDLAVVVPITVATSIALLRRRAWAKKAYYGVIGWYALVPGSVAAMAITMLLRDDPAADAGRAVLITGAAVLFLAMAARVFLPLLRPPQPPAVQELPVAGRPQRPQRVG